MNFLVESVKDSYKELCKKHEKGLRTLGRDLYTLSAAVAASFAVGTFIWNQERTVGGDVYRNTDGTVNSIRIEKKNGSSDLLYLSPDGKELMTLEERMRLDEQNRIK